ncbi:MAG TPA: AAA family ATPase [Candidatus Saccharimonadales bacterium]|nr:AAA family ATPase [Candidatus Saccharimonadales bacterium]
MKNYLITGVAGTGKSTLAKELRRRGYAAYDTEEGFSYYVDKLTGERCAYPKQPSPDWYERHERVFDEKILMNLLKKHADEPLFIASITANQAKYYGQFDKIFLLTAPDEVIVHRLGTRTNNYFGRHPLDLQRVIGRHQQFDDELKALGAQPVDSTRPIETVANEVIKAIQ